MKAITVIQPWATLLILGAKRYETRTWTTSYRGPLAIHAAKRYPNITWQLCCEEPFRSALHRGGFLLGSDLPTGVILGTVDLVACHPTRNLKLTGDEAAFGDYCPGRWAWEIANPRPLAEPIPFRGR